METTNDTKREINQWIESVLSKENVTITSMDILGNTEKGDNFLGDVIFVDVTGATTDNTTKEYNLVLKCSKRSKLLREKTPIKSIYLNEIFMYKSLFPSYTQFQLGTGVQDIFDNVPKCYGTFTGTNMEVIVIENLKKQGYYLWEKKKPMPRKYINMVVKVYGKLHATGAALASQQPEKFQEWKHLFEERFKNFNIDQKAKLFEGSIEEIYNLLKDDIDEDALQKWHKLKGNAKQFLTEINNNISGLQVILHGDCWNNNFMFQSDSGDIDLPSTVAILDWQMSRVGKPINDLGYFLFACISEDDLENLDVILDEYYKSFSNHLKELGNDPEVVYPREQFLNEWRKYSKSGLIICLTVLKLCVIDRDEAPDIVKVIEEGKEFSDTFRFEMTDTKNYRNRIKPIIKYAAENGLLDL